MWALVESDNVTQVYTRPKGLTIGEVNYPSNIFMLWTSSELEAIGIYEIVIDNSNLKTKSTTSTPIKPLRLQMVW
jgi:hypothetical protein